ncbi:DUF3093 family protein [Epidermidibacterium keratini]|uniref:DUF3093 family protein n=1 Tax=Epidermidibacterium keratini TaxID=1891644 RepID=A0A7L4YT60_9ACTN|nr:DUF3093 domain-containing protein [Epidermidibacterium keratini]QHC01959.1 DUF3093 family protein [Epidermidibacterium keratini]
MTAATPPESTSPDADLPYSERLHVSLAVWAGTLVITATVALQLALVLPIPIWITMVALVGFVALGLALAGRATVTVADGQIIAADVRLSCEQIAQVEELDARNTLAALGPAADPAAEVVTRPWVRTSVRIIPVRDEPPYLLVSSRHPEKLTAALVACASRAAAQ